MHHLQQRAREGHAEEGGWLPSRRSLSAEVELPPPWQLDEGTRTTWRDCFCLLTSHFVFFDPSRRCRSTQLQGSDLRLGPTAYRKQLLSSLLLHLSRN